VAVRSSALGTEGIIRIVSAHVSGGALQRSGVWGLRGSYDGSMTKVEHFTQSFDHITVVHDFNFDRNRFL
jgi:hypothetical protein